jgi:hypothetical protein
MSTLVTLGCSFTLGQGCYGDLDISKIDIEKYPYYSLHKDDFLSGSIGRNLQEHYGYETYYNYAQGGASNESQLLMFFRNQDQVDIDDDNVVVLWQGTFPWREFCVTENVVDAVPFNLIEQRMKFRYDFENTSPEDDIMRESILYFNVMKEYCKARGWKFFIWFWEQNHNDYRRLSHILNDNIIPISFELNNTSDISFEGHPNEIGYKKVSDSLIEGISNSTFPFPHPNETPKVMKGIDNDTI